MMFSGDGNGTILLWQTSAEKKKKEGKNNVEEMKIITFV